MTTGRTDNILYKAELLRETAKAYQVVIETVDGPVTDWFPKSQSEWYSDSETLSVTPWIKDQKELSDPLEEVE
jgi:hypothetical protein